MGLHGRRRWLFLGSSALLWGIVDFRWPRDVVLAQNVADEDGFALDLVLHDVEVVVVQII